MSNYSYAKSKANLYYYRDSNANEIDIFIESIGCIHPLEIKKSAFAKPQGDKQIFIA